jgi:hypothetical protein
LVVKYYQSDPIPEEKPKSKQSNRKTKNQIQYQSTSFFIIL